MRNERSCVARQLEQALLGREQATRAARAARACARNARKISANLRRGAMGAPATTQARPESK